MAAQPIRAKDVRAAFDIWVLSNLFNHAQIAPDGTCVTAGYELDHEPQYGGWKVIWRGVGTETRTPFGNTRAGTRAMFYQLHFSIDTAYQRQLSQGV